MTEQERLAAALEYQGATAAPPTMAQQLAKVPSRLVGALKALGTGSSYGSAEPVNAVNDLARTKFWRGSVFGVPEDVQQRNQARAMEAVSMAAPIVYHGSPHRFAPTAKNPLGEFDPTKIGTGEGAQAMGYGHYVAERPETARIYSADRAYVGATMQGKPTTVNFDDPIWIAQQTIDEFGDATKAKAHLEMVARTAGKYQSAETKAQLKDAIDLVASNKVSPKGSVYKVDLSDEAVPRMLDYDKPFSQQSENVRNAFEHLVAPIRKIEAQPSGPEWGDLASAINYDPTGRELLQLLSTNKSMNAQNVLTGGVTPAVAERIRSMGIPGIKYLDQFSRDKGTGTRNFVVFPGNEGLLNILGRE